MFDLINPISQCQTNFCLLGTEGYFDFVMNVVAFLRQCAAPTTHPLHTHCTPLRHAALVPPLHPLLLFAPRIPPASLTPLTRYATWIGAGFSVLVLFQMVYIVTT
jgi:hypothetical protein